jgi:hypothetical protein
LFLDEQHFTRFFRTFASALREPTITAAVINTASWSISPRSICREYLGGKKTNALAKADKKVAKSPTPQTAAPRADHHGEQEQRRDSRLDKSRCGKRQRERRCRPSRRLSNNGAKPQIFASDFSLLQLKNTFSERRTNRKIVFKNVNRPA